MGAAEAKKKMDRIPCTINGLTVPFYIVSPADEENILEDILREEPSLDDMCSRLSLSPQTRELARTNSALLLRGTENRAEDLADLRLRVESGQEMRSLLIALHDYMHEWMQMHFMNIAVHSVYSARRKNAEEWRTTS